MRKRILYSAHLCTTTEDPRLLLVAFYSHIMYYGLRTIEIWNWGFNNNIEKRDLFRRSHQIWWKIEKPFKHSFSHTSISDSGLNNIFTEWLWLRWIVVELIYDVMKNAIGFEYIAILLNVVLYTKFPISMLLNINWKISTIQIPKYVNNITHRCRKHRAFSIVDVVFFKYVIDI